MSRPQNENEYAMSEQIEVLENKLEDRDETIRELKSRIEELESEREEIQKQLTGVFNVLHRVMTENGLKMEEK